MIKQRKSNKLTPIFEPTSYIVIYTEGTLIKAKAKNSNLVVTRNLSHFCRILKDTDFPDFKQHFYEQHQAEIGKKLSKS